MIRGPPVPPTPAVPPAPPVPPTLVEVPPMPPAELPTLFPPPWEEPPTVPVSPVVVLSPVVPPPVVLLLPTFPGLLNFEEQAERNAVRSRAERPRNGCREAFISDTQEEE